jgi:hypothetical protein
MPGISPEWIEQRIINLKTGKSRKLSKNDLQNFIMAEVAGETPGCSSLF